jgi:phosphate transport system protein
MVDMTSTQRKHILAQFDTELEGLRAQLLSMGTVLERQVTEAISAFVRGETQRARRVIDGDQEVDDLERSIDEHCISLLALRQPEASDLRFIAATLKIVTDLERIGDLAVSTAEQVEAIVQQPELATIGELPRFAHVALDMLRSALQAFVEGDVVKAGCVMAGDGTVKGSMSSLLVELRNAMLRDSALITAGLATISVAKHLERMAAHATNIAEMVVYIARGEDIRHVNK